jgi:hypothetical protein
MIDRNSQFPLNNYIGWHDYFRAAFVLFLLSLNGCTTYPQQSESLDYRARAETQTKGLVRVSAVVLSPQESEKSFGLPLAKKGVQPVWLEIENQNDKEMYLMALSIDPDYFAPSEVAWMFRSYQQDSLYDEDDMDNIVSPDDHIDMFLDKHVPVVIPPRSTVSGYVYTNLDPGGKAFAV